MKDQELFDKLKSCFVRTVEGSSWEDFMPKNAVKKVKDFGDQTKGPFELIEMAVLGRCCKDQEERRWLTFKFCSELEKEE